MQRPNRKPDRGRHEQSRYLGYQAKFSGTNYKHKPVHGQIIGLYLAGSVTGYKD